MRTAKELKLEGEKKYFSRVNACIDVMKSKIETAGEKGHQSVMLPVAELAKTNHIKVQDLNLFFVELSKLGYDIRENDTYENIIVSWR